MGFSFRYTHVLAFVLLPGDDQPHPESNVDGDEGMQQSQESLWPASSESYQHTPTSKVFSLEVIS